MPYIGRAATNAGSVNYLDDISSGFDGSDTTFTCAISGTTITPGQENVYLYLDGVFQHPTDAYTISGSTITFTEAPASGVAFTGYVAGEGAYLDDGTVSTAKLDDDAVTASKLDDDGTGFQVGDLGVGGSLTSGDKLTVTGRLRASGGIIGDLTGDVTGNVTGNASGTAATVTGAAQSAITSVGTLTALSVDGNITLVSANDKISDGTNNILERTAGGYITIGDSAWNEIRLNTTGSTDFVLDNSGRIGIGNPTPASGLHLTGGDNTASKLTLTNTAPATDNVWSIHPQYNDQTLRFLGDSNTVLTMKDTGEIGIGTTSPATKIDVGSTSDGSGVIASFRADGFTTRLDHTSNVAHLYTGGSSNSLTFGTNSTERMRIDNSGNVGIGTTSPQKILHLENSSPYTYYKDTDDNKVWVTGVGASRYNIYEDNTDLRFTVEAGGSVGVGTANPTGNLQVQGSNGAQLKLSSAKTSVGGTDPLGVLEFVSNDASTNRSGTHARIYALAERPTNAASPQSYATTNIDGSANEGSALTFHTGIDTSGNTAMTVQEQLRITQEGNVRARKRLGARADRITIGWAANLGAGGTGGYMHYKTNLWMGGSPSGNTMYTMSVLHCYGYHYGTTNKIADDWFAFHNWNGQFYSTETRSNGSLQVISNNYVSSDGYWVIVILRNAYSGIMADYIQGHTYDVREVSITASTYSASTSGAY